MNQDQEMWSYIENKHIEKKNIKQIGENKCEKWERVYNLNGWSNDALDFYYAKMSAFDFDSTTQTQQLSNGV